MRDESIGTNQARGCLVKKRLSFCAVRDGNEIFSSSGAGIGPALEFYRMGNITEGCDAADKIIGKGAALLLSETGCRSVYGAVMTGEAAEIIRRSGKKAEYGELTRRIISRSGHGICPVEKLVEQCHDAMEAALLIEGFLKKGEADK